MRTLQKTKSVVFVLLACLVSGEAAAEGKEFYRGSDEGWFWYHDPEPVPEPEKKEKKPPIPAVPAPPKKEPTEEAPKGPPSLSVEWYQKNLEQVLNRAIDDPTEENVAAYFFLHRVMMDKANKFAVNARRVAMKHPQLDETTRKSAGSAAVRISEKQQAKIANTLSERLEARDGALWLWLGEDIYSQRMARIVKNLRNSIGVKVVVFTVNGKPPQGKAAEWFPDYVLGNGNAARRVGVTHTPAMALALPPNEIELLAHGMLGKSEIRDRLIIAGNKMGLVEEEELNTYQGRMPGAGLIAAEELPKFDGNDTETLLEVMGETFNY